MQRFRSKIDWWVMGFVICLTGMLIQLLLTMYAKGTMAEYPEHTAVYVLTIAMIWWPVWTTQYTVANGQLNIRCMWLNRNIPMADIQGISPTSNSVSSPALSLDRLKVDYLKDGKIKSVLVSPKDKQGFTSLLMSKI
ncbi:PH domain-containing protein [Acinetobacter bouvetii]|nr:PH domain-containing protein [Acinetobacter bouvetii]